VRGVVAVAIVAALVGSIVWLVARDTSAHTVDDESSTTSFVSSPTSSLADRPAPILLETTFEANAAYRIYLQRALSSSSPQAFAYIDTATRELHSIESASQLGGSIVGAFGRMLVLRRTGGLGIVDRAFARPAIPLAEGDIYVGAWREHAIVAEHFSERTTFHQYDEDGGAVRSIGLVGPQAIVGGIVGDSIVLERAGRIILVSVLDAAVSEFAVGHLIGVGGDRIVYTACAAGEPCTIVEATLVRTVRTRPIGRYVGPGSDAVQGRVAPDGSAMLLVEPRTGAEVVIASGQRFPASAAGGPRPFTWSPTGRLFLVDSPNRTLDTIDYRTGRVTTVALPAEVSRELASVSVW
jgi:hypothetical protein